MGGRLGMGDGWVAAPARDLGRSTRWRAWEAECLCGVVCREGEEVARAGAALAACAGLSERVYGARAGVPQAGSRCG